MARDLNLEAWLWYFFTSPEFYEMGAKECENTRDLFSGAAVAHGKTTYKRNGQIYDAFNTAARNFKRGAEFARLNEYNVIFDAAGSVYSDIRGMTQWNAPDQWMSEAERSDFSLCNERLLAFWHLIQHALFNGLKGGRAYMSEDNPYRDRDDGFPDRSITDDFNYYNSSRSFGWKIPSPTPHFEIDRSISVKTTEVCPWTGVWHPETGLQRHSLVFAIKGYPMPPTFHCDKTMEELAHENNGKAYSDDIETTAVETIWHPVRPVESTKQAEASSEKLHCDGGEHCPKDGFWWTPARPGAGRMFKKGEIMPKFQSDYGFTIWQWSAAQFES